MKKMSIAFALVAAIIGVVAIAAELDDRSSADVGGPTALIVDVAGAYDPVRSGEAVPEGFRQLLGRDQIQPIYEPSFVAAGAADWPEDSLVIGVSGAVEAKAYPVTHLNRHEMVNDSIEGEPILVSW